MSDVTQVEAIYLAATERTDPAERAAYLDAACGADTDLRRRVEELLAAHPKVGRFLEPPSDATQAHRAAGGVAALVIGQVIDERFKLLERIGEGGMGEVWVADQFAPVRRRVAIKLIKPGMDSRGVLARFEAERQALAVMDHPNIAKVLDAGTTGDGRPYFVMELVKGTPITEFADARKLTPKERLALFVPVCQAIQHAHQKGVIHRDIKPSNVLVELHDDRLVPKVIDFGVAKAVGQPLTEKTIYTGLGTLVGTPAYMAPEQATFNALDIDTRADVYALGVLLYELLAGSPPVESERLKRAALDEVLRLVREEEPPRPSQRLSTSQTKASIAAVRGSDPAKLSALMRGELDWIVMKALEKDRSRRYDTATALAKDVQRYINGDAVEACPPTLGYRLRKAYRRNRAAVLVGVAFTLMLLVGVAAASVLAIQARRAEALAEAKRVEAEEQTEKAERLFATNSATQEAYLEAAVEAEIRNNGSRLDADLLEYKSDARVGLLRLARPLKENVGPIKSDFPAPNSKHFMSFDDDPELVKLREFQAAAVITAGQRFGPLLPPLTGSIDPDETDWRTSPDGRMCIVSHDRTGLELIAIPSLNRLGKLREADERAVRSGFTPDARTIWTQDENSILRLWNTDGTLRARTPLRPERFIYPAGMTLGEVRGIVDLANPILVSDGVALLRSVQPDGVKPGRDLSDWNGRSGTNGACDLYDNRTGKFIRRLDRPGRQLSAWPISPDRRWLVYAEASVEEQGKSPPEKGEWELVIVSTTDGRELSRLKLPGKRPRTDYTISPSGRWIVVYERKTQAFEEDELKNVVLWRTSDWTQTQDAALGEALGHLKGVTYLNFVTDEILELSSDSNILDGMVRIGKPGSWTSRKQVLSYAPEWDATRFRGELGGTLLRQERLLFTNDPISRIKPPSGRKYAAELAKLAPDGRFFEDLDTVTEKELTCTDDLDSVIPFDYVPGFGRVATLYDAGMSCFELRILPDARRLAIPAALLQLWAQVSVGGELDTAGVFQPWDQPT